jgi:hypothetical protein
MDSTMEVLLYSFRGFHQDLGKPFDEPFDGIAYAPVVDHGVFLARGGCGQLWRIIETHMQEPGFGGEERTSPLGLVTEGDDKIEFDALEGIHMLGRLARYVDPDFRHGPYGPVVHPVRLYACGIGIQDLSFKVTGQAFCHLAAARISRTQEKDLCLWGF